MRKNYENLYVLLRCSCRNLSDNYEAYCRKRNANSVPVATMKWKLSTNRECIEIIKNYEISFLKGKFFKPEDQFEVVKLTFQFESAAKLE